MTETHIKAVANFFFYALLDDRLATKLATKALRDIKKQGASASPSELNSLAVSCSQKYFLKFRRLAALGMSGLSSEKGWKVPPKTDLGPWKEFQKKATPDEQAALIWSKIVGYSDDEIALGLGVSKGTVIYRVGNALRILGQLSFMEARRL